MITNSKLSVPRKEMLLNISIAFARVQHRNQLFRTISETVKPLFPFDFAGLFVIDTEKDCFYELLEEGKLDKLQDRLAKDELLEPWPYSGSHPKSWIYTEQPKLFDINEQAKIYPNPRWKLMQAEGLQQLIGAPLYVQEKKLD